MVACNRLGGTADGSQGAIQLSRTAEFDAGRFKGCLHRLHQRRPPDMALGRHLAHHAVYVDNHVAHDRRSWRKRGVQNQAMHIGLQMPGNGNGNGMGGDVDGVSIRVGVQLHEEEVVRQI